MALNIAGTGLSYPNLAELYKKFGKKGLLAILSMPPSCPRVRIVAAIAKPFQPKTFLFLLD